MERFIVCPPKGHQLRDGALHRRPAQSVTSGWNGLVVQMLENIGQFMSQIFVFKTVLIYTEYYPTLKLYRSIGIWAELLTTLKKDFEKKLEITFLKWENFLNEACLNKLGRVHVADLPVCKPVLDSQISWEPNFPSYMSGHAGMVRKNPGLCFYSKKRIFLGIFEMAAMPFPCNGLIFVCVN